MDEETKFHWAEGMKFANEGIKLLFILNGAACISILTFVGNVRLGAVYFIYSMVSFALGAALGPVAMLFAYLTQLQYGNRSRTAAKYRYRTYKVVALALALFLAGIICATLGLTERNKAASEAKKFSICTPRIGPDCHLPHA